MKLSGQKSNGSNMRHFLLNSCWKYFWSENNAFLPRYHGVARESLCCLLTWDGQKSSWLCNLLFCRLLTSWEIPKLVKIKWRFEKRHQQNIQTGYSTSRSVWNASASFQRASCCQAQTPRQVDCCEICRRCLLPDFQMASRHLKASKFPV